MKRCSRCEETKPLACFDKNQNWCRPCKKQYSAEYEKTPKRKAARAKYRQTEAGKASETKRQTKYHTKIPPGVYQILNKQTGCRYIGESAIPNNRRKDHWSHLRGGYHKNPNLQEDFNKFGEDAFEFEIIEHCEPSQLKQRETYWIKKHKDCCYNVYKV